MSTLDLLSTNMQVGNPAQYKPSSFGEVVKSAMYCFGQRTGFEIAPILETAQDYSERDKLVSQRFAPDELIKMTGTDQQLRDEALKNDFAQGKASFAGYVPDINSLKNQKLDQAIIAGREQDPTKWQDIKTTEELREQKRNRARAAMESYQEIASRATPFDATVGSLVGGLGAAFTDPINIATLPFGATSSMGILKAMRTEAILNAAVETAEIPLVASWQKELGYKYGVGDAALDVVTAGVGGAALTGIVRGARPAFEALGKLFNSAGNYVGSKSQPILQKIGDAESLPSSVRDAAKYMSRVAHIDENSPIIRQDVQDIQPRVETPTQAEDMALHRQTLQDTQDAFKGYEQPTFDERLELDSEIGSDVNLYDQLRQVRAELNSVGKPKSLLQFLKENGGIRDQGGELAYIDLKAKNYPGLLRNNGMFFDSAGEKAWEAGYFKERPSVNDMVEAIRQDFSDRNVFSGADIDAVVKRQGLQDFISQAEQHFDERGIDLSKKEVVKQLRQQAKLKKSQHSQNQLGKRNLDRIESEISAAGFDPKTSSLYAKAFSSYYDAQLSRGGGNAKKVLDEAFAKLKIQAARSENSDQTAASYFQKQDQTQTKAFKEWFGDSKVVDKEGKPLVVYHGTDIKFDVFDSKKLGSSTKSKSAQTGFFFTNNKEVAEGYADLATQKEVDGLIEQSKRLERAGKFDEAAKVMRRAEELEQAPDKKPTYVIETYLSLKDPEIIDAEERRYNDFSDEFHDAIERAKKENKDGVIVRNFIDNAGYEEGTVSDHYLVFNAAQIKSATDNQGTFDPNNPNIFKQGENRGSIQFDTPTGETIIKLFEGRDLSTLLHESGHFFLETQRLLSSVESASAQIKDDWQKTLNWLGSEDGNITTEMHEKFARGFEAYLREGNAPSVQLKNVFERFKEWLTKIYNDLSALNVNISDEIKGVFDRMLATDRQIEDLDNDLIFRPNDALASMQRDIETMESLSSGDSFRADFERLLKEKPDLEVETEKGVMTLKEVKEQIDADESILSAIKTCALGRG